jgi:poly-gamma-glutamate synthesis protein (capsule biosynthesis protein)
MATDKRARMLLAIPVVLFLVAFASHAFSLKPSGTKTGGDGVSLDKGHGGAAYADGRGVDQRKSDGSQTVKILFGGDMMFDRHIRQVAEKNGGYGFLFAKIDDLLKSEDLVVANLEGPITSQLSKSVGSRMGEASNYVFTFDPGVADTLKDRNIGVVNLGNNHILNFGKDGLAETRKFLEEAGVEYFGDPSDVSHRQLVKGVGGVRVGFVNYNQFATGGEEAAFEDIQKIRNMSDILVVYTHWGQEYVPPRESVRALARRFIDDGADLVIGSHPHVVQESEEYRGKKIYYSLGNFVFDQYFSEETRRGLLVEVSVDAQEKTLSFKEIPVTLDPNGQVRAGAAGGK